MSEEEIKQGVLKDHEIDQSVCDALGINMDELKACEDDNQPESSMFK